MSPARDDARAGVSVVIPARNAAAWIAEAIESVTRQTYCDWQAIVVDDGSTDQTAGIVRSLCAADPRVRLVTGPGRGAAAARNLGVRHATAPVIAFLDADDSWEPGKLAAHRMHLDAQPGVGVSFCRARFVRGDGTPTGTLSTRQVRGLTARDFLYENPTTTCSTLVARRAVFDEVGGFDERLARAEDIEWLTRVAACTAWRVEGIDAVLTRYRTSDTGLSSDLDAMLDGWEQALRTIAGYAPRLVERHYRRARATQLRYLARRALRLRLPPAAGLGYVEAGVRADWRILVRSPFRIWPTILLLCLSRARAAAAVAHTAATP